MSFFSKFMKKLQPQRLSQREQLMQILDNVLKPNIQYNLKEGTEILAQYLIKSECKLYYDIQEHISTLFEFLATITFDFQPIKVIQLLSILHQLLSQDELSQNISIKIRTVKMPWLQNIGTFIGIKDKNEKCQQTSSIIQLNEIPYQTPSSQFLYVQQCYFYLQLLSQNIDLYYAISFNNYPYSTKYEIDQRLKCTWIYKIQNIMNYAIQLLVYNKDYIEIQKIIYQDMLKFHSFICQEITQVLDQYATLGRCYTLSLYEIFCESNKHYEQLKRFWKEIGLQQPEQCMLSNGLLQEFLLFVSKLKLLNQIVNKKKIINPLSKIKDINKMNQRKGSQYQNEEQNIEDIETHDEVFMSNESKRNQKLFTSCAVQL
ncbi:unnamed protein product [Paramecium primaurelia]|uniref:Uncharacterized protein n=1 Tax=Paramecium primaurelia TaxID=5886 RepID=A0A8S1PRL6_PARPR|nr:unnamed protein product [Paramecium primaurelia]